MVPAMAQPTNWVFDFHVVFSLSGGLLKILEERVHNW
jgi:hypothetical protein